MKARRRWWRTTHLLVVPAVLALTAPLTARAEVEGASEDGAETSAAPATATPETDPVDEPARPEPAPEWMSADMSSPRPSAEERAALARRLLIASGVTTGVAVLAMGAFGGLYGWGGVAYDAWREDRDVLDAEHMLPVDSPERRPESEIADSYDESDMELIRLQATNAWRMPLLAVGVVSFAAAVSLFVSGMVIRHQAAQTAVLLPSPGGLVLAGTW